MKKFSLKSVHQLLNVLNVYIYIYIYIYIYVTANVKNWVMGIFSGYYA